MVLGVVLIVFSPGLGPLAPALARPSSPDSDCPRKHKHTHNAAVPCQYKAMHLPCDRHTFGSGHYNMGANSTSVSQPTSTISKMQCMSPTCFSCCLLSSLLVLLLSSRAPLRPSCPTPYRLSDAGDIVLSVTFPVAQTCRQPSLVHRCYSAPSTKSFLSTLSSQHAGSWQCCGTSPARPYHTLTSRTKGLSAGPGYLSSLLRILTPFETSIQQSRLVWRR